MTNDSDPILDVAGLSVRFGARTERVQALDDVDIQVRRGEILALVGESGCGKSVTAMAILGLLPKRTARIDARRITLGGTDLHGASDRSLRRIRGNRIGMIFQDPMTSLNPVHTVGGQIAEIVRQHRGVDRRTARSRALEMLDLVRIPDARGRRDAYPHELSGGMRQRVMIAMALACDPDLLIADEPTTALDVTVQAQIMALIADLRRDLGMSVLLITHDLGVVAETADRLSVMYAGRIVEEGTVGTVFSRPSHGYTAGLLGSLPAEGKRRQSRLAEIPGAVPRLSDPAPACAFADRCAYVTADCRAGVPPVVHPGPGHRCRCIRPDAVYADLSQSDIVRAWQ
ncbi:ABC transporter ATP-binding protein [Roseisalinus antarcticus]|uniref:Oligopeptide transport ATP-binding protein OppD n=1 Tax=Roseisalinus antarcticus TaxID=254357 RepID=A0A1Y5TUV8_9RHOB|nr:ABC transporter ATP-binding protein [Roseisalinus antarcticus]SLN73560.1 Oligopeptide transport ATP-binding protein OppD [Roseisalinus antarcticus]